jgi:hypothetical protein
MADLAEGLDQIIGRVAIILDNQKAHVRKAAFKGRAAVEQIAAPTR